MATIKKPRDVPPAPAGLPASVRAWWRHVHLTYTFEPHELELARLACYCLQRGHQARAAIAREGLTFKDKHGVKRPHPAIAIERNATAQFAKLCRQMKVDESAEGQSRAAKIGAYRAATA
jgi:phage terminase small subunit